MRLVQSLGTAEGHAFRNRDLEKVASNQEVSRVDCGVVTRSCQKPRRRNWAFVRFRSHYSGAHYSAPHRPDTAVYFSRLFTAFRAEAC